MIKYKPNDGSTLAADGEPPPPERTPERLADRDDIDLYCLKCGYNLRGLTGDPRRCPECGFQNPLGDLEVPAERISRQLKKMETAPAIALLGIVLLIASSSPLIMLIVHWVQGRGLPSDLGRDVRDLYLTVWFSAFLAGALMLVVFGVARFQRACAGRVGWRRVFLRYQIVGIGLSLLVGAAILTPLLSGDAFMDRHRGSEQGVFVCGAMLVIPVVALALVFRFVRRVHRWLRAPMDQLQRETAVRIAREVLRRRLAGL